MQRSMLQVIEDVPVSFQVTKCALELSLTKKDGRRKMQLLQQLQLAESSSATTEVEMYCYLYFRQPTWIVLPSELQTNEIADLAVISEVVGYQQCRHQCLRQHQGS